MFLYIVCTTEGAGDDVEATQLQHHPQHKKKTKSNVFSCPFPVELQINELPWAKGKKLFH